MPNDTPRDPVQTIADLQRELAQARAERDEALAQQTATAEVLQVINSSPGDLAPVFEAMLEKALRLCDVGFGALWSYDGEYLHVTAVRGAPAQFTEFLRQGPHQPVRLVQQRLLGGEPYEQVADLALTDAYSRGEPLARAGVDLGGVRTLLGVPLRKDNKVLGIFAVYRQEVRPFSDKQIALLQNFAAQAVIAMENARLITETREALEQQTATAEVLGVINSSPGDLVPVFDAMLDKATTLLGADFGCLLTYENDHYRAVALRNVPPAYAAVLQGPLRPGGKTTLARIARGEAVAQISDIAELGSDEPMVKGALEIGGFRTVLSVALRKDGALLGAITAYRQEVRPFTDKQIALLENFAAQAVIAMENARLITETREALEQQTATAEVLQVINSSPGDLAPVFDAMLEKATSLCAAPYGALRLFDGERFNVVAIHGEPAFTERMRREVVTSAALYEPIRRGERIVNIPDVRESAAYGTHAIVRERVDLGGVRSYLAVALRKEESLVGALIVYRQQVRPFSDKEIALLQNFAAQAVIAMENACLITETREALEQQTATAEVLQVINSSPGDLAPVFEAMLEKALRLCGAGFGLMNTYDGQRLERAASIGVPAAYDEWRTHNPLVFAPGSVPAQILAGERFVHVVDWMASELYANGDPNARALVDVAGARTVVSVPLLRDESVCGIITIFRQEVRPFSDKQIALLQNFAAQAVIAMENARLITETREALEQQTATAEVLQVINSSPGDLAPVFEAMLEKALRLCEAVFGGLTTYDGERFHTLATRGLSPALADVFREPFIPSPESFHEQVARGELLVHGDILENPSLRSGSPQTRGVVELGGARTGLVIALRKDDRLVGSFWFYRQEVRPFSDKQIVLLQNFAAQAVIAMENARLITETREAFDQQTATTEVLQVINASPGDLAPVFDAMLEKAMRLCTAAFGVMTTYDGETFWTAAHRGLPLPFAEYADTMKEGWKGAHTRLAEGADVVHLLDAKDDEAYRALPSRRALVDLGGARTVLLVGLRKDDALLGSLTIYRQEVRAFSDKEISLLQNFAAQAVIAMENARLLDGIRAARDTAESALRELRAAQANLIQAEKMASLGQLTAGIAHEIKNPLNFVNNFASLSVEFLDELKETTAPAVATLGDDKRAEIDETMVMLTGNLEKIAEHGRRADGIVKSMLEHSRGVTGERREIDLNGLVEEALNLAYHGARAQDQTFNITLERKFDQTLAPIELAPQEITRVCLNLFGNGFYAATKRRREAGNGSFKPALTVATRDLGDAVEIRVRDNGTGIPADIKDKLFQPFFTTKPTGEGTGLGLSISYDIVTQQHGGTITVESEPGSYTEFTIRLPRQ